MLEKGTKILKFFMSVSYSTQVLEIVFFSDENIFTVQASLESQKNQPQPASSWYNQEHFVVIKNLHLGSYGEQTTITIPNILMSKLSAALDRDDVVSS